MPGVECCSLSDTPSFVAPDVGSRTLFDVRRVLQRKASCNSLHVRLMTLQVGGSATCLCFCGQRDMVAFASALNKGTLFARYSGCHWTPTKKRRVGSSIPSMIPSSLRADATSPGARASIA